MDGAIGEATLAAVEVYDSADLVNQTVRPAACIREAPDNLEDVRQGLVRRIPGFAGLALRWPKSVLLYRQFMRPEAAPKADGPPATTKQEGF